MAPHLDYNPIMNLWKRLGSNKILDHYLSKWLKFIKLCMMIVLGRVQNKCITHKLILHELISPMPCSKGNTLPKALADFVFTFFL